MRILHLSFSDRVGGAARSALRLHQGLLAEGADSRMLVMRSTGDERGVCAIDDAESEGASEGRLAERYYIAANRTEVSNTYFSFRDRGVPLADHPEVVAADVLNLHWVAGMVSPAEVRRLTSLVKPVVWTFHDLGPVTGGCHFPAGCDGFTRDCDSCPQLLSDPARLPAAQLAEARRCLGDAPWSVVCPSRWLAEMVRRSHFADRRIDVLPYGIDAATFQKLNRADVCADLGLQRSCTYLCVGAHDLSEKRKGGDDLRAILARLAKDRTCSEFIRRGKWRLLCFGRDARKLEHCGWQMDNLAYVDSDAQLAAIYSASTAMLFCSSEDNLPNTILEAMACGCPVAAYSVGGVPDLIDHGDTGFLAPAGDVESLSNRVAELMADRIRAGEMGGRAQRKIIDNFTLGLQAERYLTLYRSLMETPPASSPSPDAPPREPVSTEVLAESLKNADREIVRYEKEVIPAYEAKFKWLEDQVAYWRRRTPGHWLRTVRSFFANTWDLLVREKMKPDEIVVRWFLLLAAKRPRRIGVLRQYSPRPVAYERLPDITVAEDQLPSISVVTPSFNQGVFVGATVESILSQNYPKLEYIVADGGSTDETVEILRQQTSPQLAWFSEKDRGQADAIVKGFARSSGDIMAWVNSDDVLAPGVLRLVGDYFVRNPNVDAVYGHRIILDTEGGEIGRWVVPRYRRERLRYFDFVPQETLFMRRAAYERSGGVDATFQFALDWDLLLRLQSTGATLVRLPYFMGGFRVHDEQKTSQHIRSVGRQEMERLRRREGTLDAPSRYRNRLMTFELMSSFKCEFLMALGIRSTRL